MKRHKEKNTPYKQNQTEEKLSQTVNTSEIHITEKIVQHIGWDA